MSQTHWKNPSECMGKDDGSRDIQADWYPVSCMDTELGRPRESLSTHGTMAESKIRLPLLSSPVLPHDSIQFSCFSLTYMLLASLFSLPHPALAAQIPASFGSWTLSSPSATLSGIPIVGFCWKSFSSFSCSLWLASSFTLCLAIWSRNFSGPE